MPEQRERRLPAPAARPELPPPPFLIAGLERAGTAAITALRRFVEPASLYGWDGSAAPGMRRQAVKLRAAGITTWLGAPPALEGPLRACTVIKSPGIDFRSPLIKAALDLGLEVIDELELGWRLGRVPVVAVTGTNGKSTVCSLVSAIAAAAGLNAPLAGNSQFGLPLSAIAASSADLIVCEVSSFQLEGCSELLPEAAILTNIRPEHLNRHGTLDAYAGCKRRAFIRGDRATPLAVLNLDDDRGAQLAREVRAAGGVAVGYGRAPGAEFRLRRCSWSLDSGWIEADTPGGRITLETHLPGPHNAANVLAALAAGHALGLEPETTIAAVERMPGVPGRFELIDEGQAFDVIVDFAHTPDAVSVVLQTARTVVERRGGGRLHALLSVAGHRTRALSGPMGATAARIADRVVVTEGSSYEESREEVMAPLIDGARSVSSAVEVVPDRPEAIRQLLADAGPGDLVLVLGRGALSHLWRARGEGIPCDDREVVRDGLRAIGAAGR